METNGNCGLRNSSIHVILLGSYAPGLPPPIHRGLGTLLGLCGMGVNSSDVTPRWSPSWSYVSGPSLLRGLAADSGHVLGDRLGSGHLVRDTGDLIEAIERCVQII